MEKHGMEEPGSSKNSNLIIITPEELQKLGLFKDVLHTATIVDTSQKHRHKTIESLDISQKKEVANLNQCTKNVLNLSESSDTSQNISDVISNIKIERKIKSIYEESKPPDVTTIENLTHICKKPFMELNTRRKRHTGREVLNSSQSRSSEKLDTCIPKFTLKKKETSLNINLATDCEKRALTVAQKKSNTNLSTNLNLAHNKYVSLSPAPKCISNSKTNMDTNLPNQIVPKSSSHCISKQKPNSVNSDPLKNNVKETDRFSLEEKLKSTLKKKLKFKLNTKFKEDVKSEKLLPLTFSDKLELINLTNKKDFNVQDLSPKKPKKVTPCLSFTRKDKAPVTQLIPTDLKQKKTRSQGNVNKKVNTAHKSETTVRKKGKANVDVDISRSKSFIQNTTKTSKNEIVDVKPKLVDVDTVQIESKRLFTNQKVTKTKELNIISNAQVCFSSEEIKLLVSKPESKCRENSPSHIVSPVKVKDTFNISSEQKIPSEDSNEVRSHSNTVKVKDTWNISSELKIPSGESNEVRSHSNTVENANNQPLQKKYEVDEYFVGELRKDDNMQKSSGINLTNSAELLQPVKMIQRSSQPDSNNVGESESIPNKHNLGHVILPENLGRKIMKDLSMLTDEDDTSFIGHQAIENLEKLDSELNTKKGVLAISDLSPTPLNQDSNVSIDHTCSLRQSESICFENETTKMNTSNSILSGLEAVKNEPKKIIAEFPKKRGRGNLSLSETNTKLCKSEITEEIAENISLNTTTEIIGDTDSIEKSNTSSDIIDSNENNTSLRRYKNKLISKVNLDKCINKQGRHKKNINFKKTEEIEVGELKPTKHKNCTVHMCDSEAAQDGKSVKLENVTEICEKIHVPPIAQFTEETRITLQPDVEKSQFESEIVLSGSSQKPVKSKLKDTVCCTQSDTTNDEASVEKISKKMTSGCQESDIEKLKKLEESIEPTANFMLENVQNLIPQKIQPSATAYVDAKEYTVTQTKESTKEYQSNNHQMTSSKTSQSICELKTSESEVPEKMLSTTSIQESTGIKRISHASHIKEIIEKRRSKKEKTVRSKHLSNVAKEDLPENDSITSDLAAERENDVSLNKMFKEITKSKESNVELSTVQLCTVSLCSGSEKANENNNFFAKTELQESKFRAVDELDNVKRRGKPKKCILNAEERLENTNKLVKEISMEDPNNYKVSDQDGNAEDTMENIKTEILQDIQSASISFLENAEHHLKNPVESASSLDKVLKKRGRQKNKVIAVDVIEKVVQETSALNDPKIKENVRVVKSEEINDTSRFNISAKQNDTDQQDPEISDNIVTSTPLPKKQLGKRKRANEFLIPVVYETKRKRTNINYFELENGGQDIIEFKKRSCSSESTTEVVSVDLGNKRPRGRPRKLFKTNAEEENNIGGLRSNKEDDPLIQPKNKHHGKAMIKDSIQENNSVELQSNKKDNFLVKSKNKPPRKTTEMDSMGEKSTVELLSNKNYDSLKKPKKKRHGKTTEMIESIFVAAIRNNSKSEGIKDNINNTTLDTGDGGECNIIYEEDGKTTCAICKQKLAKNHWSRHNKTIHLNLAWREGEQPVKLDNEESVNKILEPLLQEDGCLLCKKCNSEYGSVKSYITHLDECKIVVSDKISCAVCKEEMTKGTWNYHKQKFHNNLAWRTGDTPLDLNDQALVMTILNQLYKAKKPLRCEKCGNTKKSVVGFLSHKAQCGIDRIEDAQIPCKICQRLVLPVSMPSHMKFIHENPKKLELLQDSEYFEVNHKATSSKRQAAKTAMLVIGQISKEKIVEEYEKYFTAQLDFTADFVHKILQQELTDTHIVKCKFSNCDYEINEIEKAIEHLQNCNNRPTMCFTCKKCLLTCETEEVMVTHITTAHNAKIDADFKAFFDDDDENESERYSTDLKRKVLSDKKRVIGDVNHKRKPACLYSIVKRPRMLFSHAMVFSLDFCGKYYQNPLLFNHLRYSKARFLLLEDELIHDYLPKTSESCAVATRKVQGFTEVLGYEYEFKKFDLFETERFHQGINIFCGGPVNALAWMPTPHKYLNKNQVLAVACGNNFDGKYFVDVNYNESSVIQFWDFGILKNKAKFSEPNLLFCLAYDFGPIWHMEWCPSGCFDCSENNDLGDEMLRMGLLAVAGTSPGVFIYTIPVIKEEQMGLIYKVAPVCKLYLTLDTANTLGRKTYYATKISWSKGVGHRYIAVGYTDGMVGIFDLDTQSSLLKSKDDDGVDILLPYKSFQAHFHAISALDLVHLNGGNKYLMTASFDRDSFIWDLDNDAKLSTLRKSQIISDGAWLTNWLSYVVVGDETSSNSFIHSCVKSCRDYLYEYVYLSNSHTTINSISSSSWLNGIVHASTVGEVVAVFPNQMLYSLDTDKYLRRSKYLMGYAKLIDKHLTPKERVSEEVEKQKALNQSAKMDLSQVNLHYNKYEPMTYHEVIQKYGLLFCDINMEKIWNTCKNRQSKFSSNHEQLEKSKSNLYSLQAVNKITFNPNLQASLYYATGHQAGFVRISYLKFLEKDPQIV